MATAEFNQRDDLFYKLRADMTEVLSHPDIEFPDHPYIDALKVMADYAVLGVIDTANGVLHSDKPPFQDSIILAPVLQRDLRMGSVSVSEALCKKPNDVEQMYDFSCLSEVSGLCDAGGNVVTPIVSVAPWMSSRPAILAGTTFIHELDHAHWWWKHKQMFKFGTDFDDVGRAEQEISAVRLEQQILFAHVPELYDHEYGRASARFADLDFSKHYLPRTLDKLKKSVRVTAFLNFLLDELGGDVNVRPNDEVIAALKAQAII